MTILRVLRSEVKVHKGNIKKACIWQQRGWLLWNKHYYCDLHYCVSDKRLSSVFRELNYCHWYFSISMATVTLKAVFVFIYGSGLCCWYQLSLPLRRKSQETNIQMMDKRPLCVFVFHHCMAISMYYLKGKQSNSDRLHTV